MMHLTPTIFLCGCLAALSSTAFSQDTISKSYRLRCFMARNSTNSSESGDRTDEVTINVPSSPIVDGRIHLPQEIPDVYFDLYGYTGIVRVTDFFSALILKQSAHTLSSTIFPTGVAPQRELREAFPMISSLLIGDWEVAVQCSIAEI